LGDDYFQSDNLKLIILNDKNKSMKKPIRHVKYRSPKNASSLSNSVFKNHLGIPPRQEKYHNGI
jgi:hypothetical protein